MKTQIFRPLTKGIIAAMLVMSFAAFNLAMASGQPNWVLSHTEGNVDFYYAIQECNGHNAVLLKFDNRNNSTVQVSWNEDFDDHKSGRIIPGVQGTKSITLPVGTTQQSDCHVITCADCIITQEQVIPTHPADVRGYAFKDVSVTLLP